MRTSAPPLTVLTAYDFNTARALEEAGIDMVLVGDSLAMVALGYKNTTLVSTTEMLVCTAAVARGLQHTSVIADLPYATISKPEIDQIVLDAELFIEAGASIIKIENARTKSLELISRLRSRSIRVMGHIGYTPQDLDLSPKDSLLQNSTTLIQEALALVDAGVESMVLEMIPASIARDITEAVTVPTIGIGSGPYTNGQVLVSDDLLGRYDLLQPKFLRRYSHQYQDMLGAFRAYISDVRNSKYPSLSESY